MKKKILLSTFLLLFSFILLNYSSESYAWSYDLTYEDVIEVLDYYNVASNKRNELINNKNAIFGVYDVYFLMIEGSGSRKYYRLIGANYESITTNSTSTYININGTWMNCTSGQYRVQNSTTATPLNSGSYYLITGDYKNKDGVMLRENPYESVNILGLNNMEPPEPEHYFIINNASYTSGEVTISNNNIAEDVTDFYVYNKSNFDDYMCYVAESEFLSKVRINQYAYDKDLSSWVVIYDFVECNLNYYDVFCDVYLKTINKLPNTVVELYAIPNTTDYDTQNMYFYLSDDNTIITNGELDISNTFSGDYYYNYKNNINNIIQSQRQDKLISAVESGDNAIISAITDDTIPSGEEPTIEDLPIVSISSGDDPSNEFFSWLLQEIVSILNDDTNTTLDIPIYNEVYTISSDVFKLEIEPLRTFISAGWWFIVGVPFLKYIRSCIEKLKGGEIPASDEKNDLLGNVL